jgi:hypothetical protein
MGSIEILHIEEIYHFLDMLSLTMTDLQLTFPCEFGHVAQQVTFYSFKLYWLSVRFVVQLLKMFLKNGKYCLPNFLENR